MKYTICVTQRCNLRCKYCYIYNQSSTMPISVAEKIVDFIFKRTPSEENIYIGYFGGEPLLEFKLIKRITKIIEDHPSFERDRVELSIVTNGTIYSEEIARFVSEHGIVFGISCDGPKFVHDQSRCFPNGRGSSDVVEMNIRQAREDFPSLMVNAVYHPRTFRHLFEVVDYFSSLGVVNIYLNPDFTARWTKREAEELPGIYDLISDKYIDFYLEGKPHFISLIDSKIAVILRGGYKPLERCRMGNGEFAFAPSGNIYLCERLIGADEGNMHCIGNVVSGFSIDRVCGNRKSTTGGNRECKDCGINDYCMNWCGCSNFFSSGEYDRVGPFLCASERAAINSAYRVIQTLEEKMGAVFSDHLAGSPSVNSYYPKLLR